MPSAISTTRLQESDGHAPHRVCAASGGASQRGAITPTREANKKGGSYSDVSQELSAPLVSKPRGDFDRIGRSAGKERWMRSLSYRSVLLALRVALGLAVVWLLIHRDATAAFIVAVFLSLSFIYLLRDDPRPLLFDVLFAMAALLGALGYVFGLFDAGVPYDKPIHAFTTFSVSLAFFFLFYRGAVPRQRAIALATSVVTLGVTVGAFWEIFEWFFVGEYTMADTIGDLIADTLGALAAALVALFVRRRGDRLT